MSTQTAQTTPTTATAPTATPATGTHLHDLLGPWVPHQRWYPAKGREARTEVVGRLLLPWADPEDVRVIVHVLRVTTVAGGGAGHVDIVQVPLVHRRAPRSGSDAVAALLGVLTDPDGIGWFVYDGPHDPAYVEALLALLDGQICGVALDATGEQAEHAGTAVGHHPAGVAPPEPGTPARVLRGEQSNTSIIVEPDDGSAPVIVKVFRTLHPGRNPDVEVQASLAPTGVRAVPALAGWVEGSWPVSSDPSQPLVSGDLAVASEFLAGAQDAWREATAAVVSGTDFSERARALGAATAQVHAALAEQLPSRPADDDDARRLAEGWLQRLEWALSEADVLAPRADALRARVASSGSLDAATLGTLQRVHGDYHLGQVLDVPGRGWVLLDFEGEPLRPLAERTLPDLALRDVAGMLRSFDYAARQTTVGLTEGPEAAAAREAARSWADAARAAFCEGYAAVTGADPRSAGTLLDALELDKALYEVVYEVRNRPAWVPVPLAAIDRVLAAGPAA
ncbi:trehalose synthase-fused probable maltokinase [Quadrisphaera granulorum]|uniref:Maltokinase n=1 Tax=Quadrisphaera granulorum TaxID=317664 RepID=A0A316AHB1_9ACTN|nr:aminoglycoside phosphotransferase [Quadrisphaera granulorum]PWJ56304.1 trehalose synthase-fused probable maltokinase [Quadrisphaera granulorum]SZE94938.1 trehalose synthase-fused probable maltokinase [Quadrisphaera granulorum]